MMTYSWYVSKLARHLPGVNFPGHRWDLVQSEEQKTFNFEQFLSLNTRWVWEHKTRAERGIKGRVWTAKQSDVSMERRRDWTGMNEQVGDLMRQRSVGRPHSGECREKISLPICWGHKRVWWTIEMDLIYLIWLNSLWWTRCCSLSSLCSSRRSGDPETGLDRINAKPTRGQCLPGQHGHPLCGATLTCGISTQGQWAAQRRCWDVRRCFFPSSCLPSLIISLFLQKGCVCLHRAVWPRPELGT